MGSDVFQDELVPVAEGDDDAGELKVARRPCRGKQVGCFALQVLALTGAADDAVQFRAAIAAGDIYGTAVAFSGWIQYGIDQGCQGGFNGSGRTVPDATLHCCTTIEQFADGKPTHIFSISLFHDLTISLPARTRRYSERCEDGDDYFAHTDDSIHPVKFLLFHNDILYFIIFMVGVDLLKPLNS